MSNHWVWGTKKLWVIGWQSESVSHITCITCDASHKWLLCQKNSPTAFFLQSHSSQITNCAPQSLPTASIVLNRPPGCSSTRFYCLFSPHPRISTWEGWTGSSHLAMHMLFTYTDLLSFLRNIFIAKQIYFLLLIKYFVNRLNDLMFHGLVDTIFKSYKLQAWRKATTCSNNQQEVFILSRWTIWGDMRPPSRDIAGHVQFLESSSLSKFPIASTYRQETQMSVVRLFKLPSTSWYRNFLWKLNE